MNPMLQEKLLDLLVNVIAIILGGGLITLFIEWRRHKREMSDWQREDEMIEIDIPRADLRVFQWDVTKEVNDNTKLMIYENKLDKAVRRVVVVAEFVIRNTTAREIIITSYGGDLLQVPSGNDKKRYYDLETNDLISIEEMGVIRLKPYATIPRTFILAAEFGPQRRLEEAPSTLVIEAKTSNGKVIQQKESLKIIPVLVDIEIYKGEYHLKKYASKMAPPEDEVPF